MDNWTGLSPSKRQVTSQVCLNQHHLGSMEIGKVPMVCVVLEYSRKLENIQGSGALACNQSTCR